MASGVSSSNTLGAIISVIEVLSIIIIKKRKDKSQMWAQHVIDKGLIYVYKIPEN